MRVAGSATAATPLCCAVLRCMHHPQRINSATTPSTHSPHGGTPYPTWMSRAAIGHIAACFGARPRWTRSSTLLSSSLHSAPPSYPYPLAHSPQTPHSASSTAVALQLTHRLGPHLNDRTLNDARDNPVNHLLEQRGFQALIYPPITSPTSAAPTASPTTSSVSSALLALQHERLAPLLSSYERLYPLPRPPARPRPSLVRMEEPSLDPSTLLPSSDADSVIPTPARSSAPSPTPAFAPSPLAPLSMMELVQLLQSTLIEPQPDLQLIHQYMSAYDGSLGEWRRFAFWDDAKRYTRNLIATDYQHFTLMLLCWNPKLGSPVHNHASSQCRSTHTRTGCGLLCFVSVSADVDVAVLCCCAVAGECFMRVLEGQVVESQYHSRGDESRRMKAVDAPRSLPLSPPHSSECVSSVTKAQSPSSSAGHPSSSSCASPSSSSSSSSSQSSSSTPLRLRRRVVARSGSVLFINDSIGLHKIDNPFDAPAVTLHCYIPPYDSCQCYEEDTGHAHESYVSFHSENGELVDFMH